MAKNQRWIVETLKINITTITKLLRIRSIVFCCREGGLREETNAPFCPKYLGLLERSLSSHARCYRYIRHWRISSQTIFFHSQTNSDTWQAA